MERIHRAVCRVRVPIGLILGVLGLQSAAVTQGHCFEICSGPVGFSSRGAIPRARSGDVVARVPRAWFSGIGGVYDGAAGAVVGRATGFRAVIQDEDQETPETFSLALLADDVARPGRPDPAPTGELLRVSGLHPPPAAGTGPISWTVQVTFSTPFDEVPKDRDFYLACGVTAAPGPGVAGISVHTSVVGCGEDPIVGGVVRSVFAQSIERTATPVVRSFMDRTHRIGLLTEAPLLQLGAGLREPRSCATNPQFGIAGVYPDNSGSHDDFAFRLRSNPGATAFVFGQVGGFATPVRWGTFGDLCLDLIPPPFFVTTVTVPPGAVEGIGTVRSTCMPRATMSFQALDTSLPFRLTNGCALFSQ